MSSCRIPIRFGFVHHAMVPNHIRRQALLSYGAFVALRLSQSFRCFRLIFVSFRFVLFFFLLLH